MVQGKTNAMRILDAKKIIYHVITYDIKDGKMDGVSVAKKIDKDPRQVYKTLVAQGNSKEIYVFIIPVEAELDLKKAAKIACEKKVEMIPVKDIQKWTGYIRGGCSPIGMKKAYSTFIEQNVHKHKTIVVSGGKIGLQLEMSVADLERAVKIEVGDITKEEE